MNVQRDSLDALMDSNVVIVLLWIGCEDTLLSERYN
jgi:hypothetical protein